MLPDLWTAQTDAPPTRSLEIASRFPQHPQPQPTRALPTDLNGTEELQILCPPPGVAGFQTFFTGRFWTFGDTETGHDLDRLYGRDGIVYGAEIKNTLKYIPPYEHVTKLKMCRVLGVRPLFVARMAPKNYIKETLDAGGYTMLFGKQMYPFGHDDLVERVRERLELPVGCPKGIEAGVKENFEKAHRRMVGGAKD